MATCALGLGVSVPMRARVLGLGPFLRGRGLHGVHGASRECRGAAARSLRTLRPVPDTIRSREAGADARKPARRSAVSVDHDARGARWGPLRSSRSSDAHTASVVHATDWCANGFYRTPKPCAVACQNANGRQTSSTTTAQVGAFRRYVVRHVGHILCRIKILRTRARRRFKREHAAAARMTAALS